MTNVQRRTKCTQKLSPPIIPGMIHTLVPDDATAKLCADHHHSKLLVIYTYTGRLWLGHRVVLEAEGVEVPRLRRF